MPAVPAEYLGQARLFRQAVLIADRRVQAAFPTITAPLIERYRRKPTLRKQQMQDFVRAWQQRVGDEFTLVRRVSVTPEELLVDELRAATSKEKKEDWEQSEWQAGISVVRVTASAKDREVKLDVQPWAHLLQHSLARRFERGMGRDAASVVRDLRTMAETLLAYASAGAGLAPAEIECLEGRWVGAVNVVRDDDASRNVRLYHCKTFLN